jgi:hypothetical protein
MKTILVLCTILSFSLTGCKSCSKPTCDDAVKYSQIAANRVAEFLDCKNPTAIAGDIFIAVDKLNLCTNPVEQGAIASIVCKPVSVLVAQLAVTGLPARWECSGGAGAKALETAVYAACSALPY